MKNVNIGYWIFTALLIEAAIFMICTFLFDSYGDVFRHSARYSGRASLIAYLVLFGSFSFNYDKAVPSSLQSTRKWAITFALMHGIHFLFLAASVWYNQTPLVPIKLLGGFLAYAFILLYPFVMLRIQKSAAHLAYFAYVGLVMMLTYVARVNRDFDGAEPSIAHYASLLILILAFFFFVFTLFRRNRKKHF